MTKVDCKIAIAFINLFFKTLLYNLYFLSLTTHSIIYFDLNSQMLSFSFPILLLSLAYAVSAAPFALRSNGALLPIPASQQRGTASSMGKPRIKLGSSYPRVRVPIPKSYNIHPHVIKPIKPASSSSASSSAPTSSSYTSATSTSYYLGLSTASVSYSSIGSNSTTTYMLGFSSQSANPSGSSYSTTASASVASNTSIPKRNLRIRARLERSH